jgi:transposase-like protein
MAKEIKKKKPYYGLRTKKRVIDEYFYTSASLNELSEIHGILGSNTVSDWLRKYSNKVGRIRYCSITRLRGD